MPSGYEAVMRLSEYCPTRSSMKDSILALGTVTGGVFHFLCFVCHELR